MSSLKIRVYSKDEHASEEKLRSTTTIPLQVMHIVSKHIPDQIIRFIYDKDYPTSGFTAINMRTIVHSINEILQEIERNRRVGELNGIIAELVLEPEDVTTEKEKMEGTRVVFAVEG
ncbi:MAG: hypothetical protein AAGF95_16630 [Chloroflexota bacterium]